MSLIFKIFTLNCWGIPIPLICKDRQDRINAIGDALASNSYDVVCLQEVWSDRDYFLIKEKVSGVLPYSHYFHSGVTGSGICIFSKYQIKETFFHQWPLNGYIHKIHHADWFGGKGVGLCKLSVDRYTVHVYSAHLHAEYDRNFDEYEAHRILQAYDTAQFISLTSEGADLVILAGDLNTEPGDLAYRALLNVAGLVDSFLVAERMLNSDKHATCESWCNSYTPSNLAKKKNLGKRIDYIMYHPGSKLKVVLQDYRLPLPDRVQGKDFSYSDHEAVEATIALSEKKVETTEIDIVERQYIFKDCLVILNNALDRLKTHKTIYLLFAVVLMALLIMSLVFETPYGYIVLFNIVRAIVSILIFICLLMALIWNSIERNAILAGKLAIEVNMMKYSES
ncbi:unnamed protein product [Acanthoscelides obtectus]|uniref:sphingomyelin phosphodiesterase n=1 Tax=Acanthoscelides obtectus TaxID=200917 RepID=A0A9P0LYR0_ACAOB|nr:unnamed protein product [Acanthoscelides obtectus]CAK1638694.1 Putative neutral sphingomyelinase [Acanthoscelides obtectus]